MWGYVLENGMRVLALHTELGLTEHHITPYIRFMIPFPKMEGIAPDALTWWSTAGAVCLLYRGELFFPEEANARHLSPAGRAFHPGHSATVFSVDSCALSAHAR